MGELFNQRARRCGSFWEIIAHCLQEPWFYSFPFWDPLGLMSDAILFDKSMLCLHGDSGIHLDSVAYKSKAGPVEYTSISSQATRQGHAAGKLNLSRGDEWRLWRQVGKVHLVRKEGSSRCNPGMRSTGSWVWLSAVPSIEMASSVWPQSPWLEQRRGSIENSHWSPRGNVLASV